MKGAILATLVALMMIGAAVPASADPGPKAPSAPNNITWEKFPGGPQPLNITWE